MYNSVCLLGYAKYACPLLFVFHPFPSPVLLIDAQDESTFLLVEVVGIPFVLMKPRNRKTIGLSEKGYKFILFAKAGIGNNMKWKIKISNLEISSAPFAFLGVPVALTKFSG